MGAADEALDAVDDIDVAVAHRRGAHGARIRSGVRFGLGEASALLAAQHRHQVFLAELALEVIEDGAHAWTHDALAARRQRDGAGQFLPHHDARHQAEPHAAEFLGHLHHPDADILGALLQLLTPCRLQLLAVAGLALDRNQLLIDKTTERIFEDAQLFGQCEIHRCPPQARAAARDAACDSVMKTGRTSTARTP
jgi:hypothetical protein